MGIVIPDIVILGVLILVGVLVTGLFALQIWLAIRQAQSREDDTKANILEDSIETFGKASETLGKLEKAAAQIQEVGKDVHKEASDLHNILAAPTLRGSWGEQVLEEMLKQVLPRGHYDTQHSFRDGQIVDAVIFFEQRMMPIDAKFPLEDFKRMSEAEGEEITKARKKFVRACKKHINGIAEKYIRPAENTLDLAIMYIPAENVYYELIIRDEEGGNIANYAQGKRVVPVSPNSLYAYLQIIRMGLKGLQIEKDARKIFDTLSEFEHNIDDISKDFRTVGRHVRNANKKWTEADDKLASFSDRFKSVTESGLPAGLEPEALPAPPDSEDQE